MKKKSSHVKDNEFSDNLNFSNLGLTQNGYVENQPTITSCNAGIQAALLAYVIDAVKPSQNPPRVYNGSLKEMELRAPKKISEGPQHLPH